MNKERLAILANHLRTKVPMDAFDLSIWGRKADEHSCGFAGCAVGWAVHDNLFPDLVAKVGSAATPISSNYPLAKRAPRTLDELLDTGEDAWVSVCKTFDLSKEQAHHLFSIKQYPKSPSVCEVADRITAFVAADGAVPTKPKASTQSQPESIAP